MHYVVVDLEASCWKAAWVRHRMETIEIGAVRLDDALRAVDEFDSFVRPVVVPRLSTFCRELTSITQEQVDAADTFPKAFARFVTWLGTGSRRLVTWGAFDLGQFRLDCERHGMTFPEHLAEGHVNLKTAFGAWKGLKRVAVPQALEALGLEPVGRAHRGIDDARNIARIAQLALPHVL